MAGSWGTKVEAAFNQSPLLAGCPEEPAEERLGAAGGGKHGKQGCRVQPKGSQQSTGAPGARPPHGTPLFPTAIPKKKGTVNAPHCSASIRAVPGSCQGSFNHPPKNTLPPCTQPPTPSCPLGWGHQHWGHPRAQAAKGTGQRRVQGARGNP